MPKTASTDGCSARLYREVALENDGEHIRVLDLLPGRWHQVLSLTLKVVTLSSQTHYEALSYAWGSSSQRRTVMVNGRFHLSVTDNLFNALRRLRLNGSPRTLWVDQLCIDQAEPIEKGHQVALMARIYETAAWVNVWLGEPGFVFPFNVLRPFQQPYRDTLVRLCGEVFLQQILYFLSYCVLRNDVKLIDQAISRTTPHWHERVWVIQEFCLAKRVYIQCGKRRWLFRPGWFRSPFRSLTLHNTHLPLHFGSFLHRIEEELPRVAADRSKLVRVGVHHPGHGGIYEAYQHLATSNTTDPRDRVYGLLSLFRPEEASLIGTDYTLTCAQVYARATFASIKIRGDFNVLQLVRSKQVTPGLPTWSCDPGRNTTHIWISEGWQYRWNSSKLSSIEIEIVDSNSLLTFSANIFDVVLASVALPCDGRSGVSVELGEKLFNLVVDAGSRVSKHDPFEQGRDLAGVRYGHNRTLARHLYPFKTLSSLETEATATTLGHFMKAISHSSQKRHRSADLAIESFRSWNAVSAVERSHYRWAPFAMTMLMSGYEQAARDATGHAECVSDGVSVFATQAGLLGVMPASVRPGDVIVQVRSSRPFIALREDGDLYTFQGLVFLHGPWGENVAELERLGLPHQKFILK